MQQLINVEDYRIAASKRMPRFLWEMIEGGAGNEVTLRANRAAFQDLILRPRALADVTTRDLTTTVLGQKVSMPLLLDPTGGGRAIRREAELLTARAAGRAGTIYTLSSVARAPEGVADVAQGPLWYQLYLLPTRPATEDLIRRADRAGYAALCVTIDGAVSALRERDIRNGMNPPVRITPSKVLQGLSRPRWALGFLLGRNDALPYREGPRQRNILGVRQLERAIMSTLTPVTWEHLNWIRDLWHRPLLVKGIMRADECERLVKIGIDGVIVSNHGGRQLDCVAGAIEVVPEVVAAVGTKAEVFVDSGVRRGSDVVKAVAIGAKAALIGRPYLYGLAMSGEAGVDAILEIFRNEIDNTMALLGCASVAEIDGSVVARRVDVGAAEAHSGGSGRWS